MEKFEEDIIAEISKIEELRGKNGAELLGIISHDLVVDRSTCRDEKEAEYLYRQINLGNV